MANYRIDPKSNHTGVFITAGVKVGRDDVVSIPEKHPCLKSDLVKSALVKAKKGQKATIKL